MHIPLRRMLDPRFSMDFEVQCTLASCRAGSAGAGEMRVTFQSAGNKFFIPVAVLFLLPQQFFLFRLSSRRKFQDFKQLWNSAGGLFQGILDP